MSSTPAQLKPALWPIFIPSLNDLYRWRVQLACGCAAEVLTRGKDRFPDERGYDDRLSRARLPRGEMWCPADHKTPKPYREIVEWFGCKSEEAVPAAHC
jgi:hypothetical protein